MFVEYKRDLSHNYMLIRNEGELRTDTYDMRTILTNRIYGLLPIDGENVNGEIAFRYDISECMPFVSFCEGGRVNAPVLRRLFLSILRTLEEFDDYLLDSSHLLLDPEYVFVQWESVSVYMAYVPFLEKDIQKSLLALTETVLMQISHEQQDSIVLACRILHELQGKNIQLASLRRLLEEGEESEGMVSGAKGGPMMDGRGNTPSYAAGAGQGSGSAQIDSGVYRQGYGTASIGNGGFGSGYGSASNAAGGFGQGYGTSSNAVGGSGSDNGGGAGWGYGSMAGAAAEGGHGYSAVSNNGGGAGRGYGSNTDGMGQGYGFGSNTGEAGQGYGFGSDTGGTGQGYGFGSNTGGAGQGYDSAPYAAGSGKATFGGGYGYGKQDAGRKKGWVKEKRKKEKKKKEKADGKKAGSFVWGSKKNKEKAPREEKNTALKKHLPERATVKLALLSAIPAALLFAALHVQEVFVLSTAEAAGISILTAALILVILELIARIKALKVNKHPAPAGQGNSAQEQPQAADSWDAYAGNASYQVELPKPSPGSGFQAGAMGGTAGAFVPLYQQASASASSQKGGADFATESSQRGGTAFATAPSRRGGADIATASSQRGREDFASASSQRGADFASVSSQSRAAGRSPADFPYDRWEDASDGGSVSPGVEGAAAALLPEDPGSPLTPIPLQGREILIGKQKSLVDMVIQDDTVSRIHARVIRKNGAYFISDMGSKNGTFVDGQAVVGREEVMLTEGARVRFSGCSYTYHALPASA